MGGTGELRRKAEGEGGPRGKGGASAGGREGMREKRRYDERFTLPIPQNNTKEDEYESVRK